MYSVCTCVCACVRMCVCACVCARVCVCVCLRAGVWCLTARDRIRFTVLLAVGRQRSTWDSQYVREVGDVSHVCAYVCMCVCFGR